MKNEILSFSKIQKSPHLIEEGLNKVLVLGQYKFATQHESKSGRLVLSLFIDPKAPSKVKAKVFRDQNVEGLQQQINVFFSKSGAKMKYFTQSGGGNTIIAVVYYEEDKVPATTDPTTQSQNS